jgi:hypothetical protein
MVATAERTRLPLTAEEMLPWTLVTDGSDLWELLGRDETEGTVTLLDVRSDWEGEEPAEVRRVGVKWALSNLLIVRKAPRTAAVDGA